MRDKLLKSGEYVVVKIIEVLSIPYVSKLQNDSGESDMLGAFNSLIEAIGYNYRDEFSKNHIDYSVEFLWITEEVENQTYKAKIHIYIVLRAINKNKDRAEQCLAGLSTLLNNTLHLYGYEYEDLDEKNYEKISLKVNATSMSALIKEQRVESLQNTFIPYSFSYGNISTCNFDFANLTNCLAENPNVAVSFYLIPTEFTQSERVTLDTMVQQLGVLCNGLMDQGMGQIRYPLAEKDYNTYRHYSNKKNGALFEFGIVLYGSEDETTVLSNIICGQLGKAAPFKTINLKDLNIHKDSNWFSFPWFLSSKLHSQSLNLKTKNYTRLPYVITSEEAAVFFRLPVGDDRLGAGFNINEYGNRHKTFYNDVINSGDLELGKLKGSLASVGIKIADLTKHMLITGTSGSGKSTFSVGLVDRLWREYQIPFFFFFPAKSEYRAFLKKIPELQVFTAGKSNLSPFVYNPFLPPKNVNTETYKTSLKTAFAAAVSMVSPLDKIFEDAINNCYSDYGWIETLSGGGEVFNIADFIKCFKYTFDEIGYRGDAINIGKAGIVRLSSLSYLFDNYKSIPIEDILARPTVIELSGIENNEQKSLIISLLLISIMTYINANYLGDSESDTSRPLRNLILLEEAHVLFDAQQNSSTGEANPSYIAINLLKRMLAEMRSYGVGVVIADQSPHKVTSDVISLTDIKVTFRLVETQDKQIISNSTNMTEEDEKRMTKLKPGEAFLFFSKLDEPEEIVTPNYRIENGIDITISDEYLKNNMRYWQNHKDLLCPYPECSLNPYCKGNCNNQYKVYAKELARKIYRKYIYLSSLPKEQIVGNIKYVFSHLKSIIDKELPDIYSPEFKGCLKTFLWRKIKYESGLKINEQVISSSLNRG